MLAPNSDGRKVIKGGSIPVDLVLDVEIRVPAAS